MVVITAAMDLSENRRRMQRGELFHAFVPDLVAERTRAMHACARFNSAGDVPRRRLTELFHEYVLPAHRGQQYSWLTIQRFVR